MARSAAHAERRRTALLDSLSRGNPVSVNDAARTLGVTPMTIRRDLEALEQAGAAIRKHGGAIPAQRITLEFKFDERHRMHIDEKRRIGAAAAARVMPGQTVMVDTGTTTLELAKALAARAVECTVVTSSLAIASVLWGHPAVSLVLTGGRVRGTSPDLAGPGTELLLERLTADVAFLGSDGIDAARGSFAGDADAARVAEQMAAHARAAVIVADSSKLRGASAVRYLPAGRITELITDTGAPRAVVNRLRRHGVTVTMV